MESPAPHRGRQSPRAVAGVGHGAYGRCMRAAILAFYNTPKRAWRVARVAAWVATEAVHMWLLIPRRRERHRHPQFVRQHAPPFLAR
jgi:hypothetical protein